MTVMPWEIDQPAPTPPPRPPPAQPAPTEPPYLPDRQDSVDFGRILKDAFSDALVEAGAKLRDTGKEYAQDSFDAIRRGETVDVLHPSVTATTAKGKELVVADAKSRSGRTFVQGLVIDLVFAVGTLLVALGSDFDPAKKGAWIILIALMVKTVIQTGVSYLMRLRVTPTIRTPGEKMAIMPVPRPMMKGES